MTDTSKNAAHAKTLNMPPEFQAQAAAFADAKGLSLAGREVVVEYKDAWVGRDGKTRPPQLVMIVTADAAMALALKAGRNFAPIGTEWTKDGTKWVDVWLESTPPAACRVTFEVEGIKDHVIVTHTMQEYTQGKESNGTQKSMPATMLAKATVQMGLRRIAPQALAGLYVAEEIEAMDAARDAEKQDIKETSEALTPPSDKEAKGASVSRAEQQLARREELIKHGKALRSELGDDAAREFAAHIKELKADPDKLTAAQLKSILAYDKTIRESHAKQAAAKEAAAKEAAEKEAAAASAPAGDSELTEQQTDLANAFDGEFII